MSDWNDDDYEFRDAEESRLDRVLSPEGDVADMIDWASDAGYRAMIPTREGANFVDHDGLWLIALEGGQPIHHDRHMTELEAGSNHTWNLVCGGDGTQILATEVARDIFNGIPLVEGSLIYLNTTNRHLVTRNDRTDRSVLLQVQGFGPEEGQAALGDMVEKWKRQRRLQRHFGT